ncbi:sigma-70 family RNA polymerase sigma factor [bacterium]|nr:sigma-70 family RNA polymerase sigma factor [bacterium]
MPSGPRQPHADTPTLVLVRGARSGDQAALEELCRRYLPRLERFARGRLPAYARGTLDTRDLVQDALVNSLAKLENFDPQSPGCFQAYTRQAILNALRNRVQRVKPKASQTLVLENAPDHTPSPLEELLGRDALDRYETALAGLDADERELIVGRLEFHCSFQELADTTGRASPDAARMAFKRALLRLAGAMDEGEPVHG